MPVPSWLRVIWPAKSWWSQAERPKSSERSVIAYLGRRVVQGVMRWNKRFQAAQLVRSSVRT
jgi:hypothetical protein